MRIILQMSQYSLNQLIKTREMTLHQQKQVMEKFSIRWTGLKTNHIHVNYHPYYYYPYYYMYRSTTITTDNQQPTNDNNHNNYTVVHKKRATFIFRIAS